MNQSFSFLIISLIAVSVLGKDSGLELGQKVFLNNCTACHGEKGDGQGPAARAIASRKPRNFVGEDFQYGSSKEQVYQTVSNGVAGSAMPPWKDALSEKERRAVVDYILTLRQK